MKKILALMLLTGWLASSTEAQTPTSTTTQKAAVKKTGVKQQQTSVKKTVVTKRKTVTTKKG
jgi:hypothetical protein